MEPRLYILAISLTSNCVFGVLHKPDYGDFNVIENVYLAKQ